MVESRGEVGRWKFFFFFRNLDGGDDGEVLWWEKGRKGALI